MIAPPFPRSAAALLLSALPLPAHQPPPASAPTAGGVPEAGLLLRFADGGQELGISNLVASWTDATGSGLALQQPEGRSKPWRDFYAASGHPALQFDGNDYLWADHGMPTGSSTRALSVRVDDLKSGGLLLGALTGTGLRFAPGSPYLRFEQAGEALVASLPVPLGEFVTLLASYDAATGEASIYVGGALAAQGPLPPLADDAISIGCSKVGGWPLRGYVAEVLVYDHVLSAEERDAVAAHLGSFSAGGFPEVVVTGLPRDAQVLPRDDQNLGHVEVTGLVKTKGLQAIALRVLREGAVYDTVQQDLSYGPDGAAFDLALTLEAGFSDHEVLVAVSDGSQSTIVARRLNVVAGDAFLIDGQSNAVAKDWHAEELGDLHMSHWVRSFGDARYVLLYVPPIVVSKAEHAKDLHWDVATSLVPHDHATIGQWALRMAEALKDGLEIPIAVINGGVEGSSITYHQRNDAYPTDPAGIYGRMLYRAREAGVAETARALIYYQGEADGGIPLVWKQGFDSLREDWLTDYPGLKRIYAMQIREGCGIYNDVVQEIQRTLGDAYPDVTVMSTTAVPSHEGCHYYHVGYLETGNRMARLLGRDIYHKAALNVEPPRIVGAQWTSPDQNSLLLTFAPAADTLHADPDVVEHTSVSDGTPVTAVQVAGQNQLLVQLAGPSTAATVTWRGHAYDGPWIENAAGVGALTFFNFPIQPAPRPPGG